MNTVFRTGILTAAIGIAAGFPCLAYGEEGGLREAEFLEVCAQEHAEESRYFYPLFQDPEEEAERINYEYHYREVILQPDGSVIDHPYDTSRVQCLRGGDVWMDMEDGYEISYEYHLKEMGDLQEDAETVVEGKKITPYYRAVPLDNSIRREDRTYEYFANEPEEIPFIPDFPPDYDWKSHGDATLQVSVWVKVRSPEDGRETEFVSNIGYATNLYKHQPDCYRMNPTDRDVYTVRKGDCLYRIAQKFYGNGGAWKEILERNREWISDEDLLYPGMLLVIPDASA